MRLCRRRGALLVVVLTLTIAAIAVRPLLAHAGAGLRQMYLGLHAHADPLMIGCLLAVFCASRFFDRSEQAARRWSALGVAVLFVTAKSPSSYIWHGVTTTAGLATALLIACVMLPGRRWTAMLGARPLVWIGRRSYGLYLWHFPIFYMLGALSIDGRLSPLDRAIVAWAVAFAVAAASFRFLEQPALVLKTRLAVERAGTGRTVVRYRTT